VPVRGVDWLPTQNDFTALKFAILFHARMLVGM